MKTKILLSLVALMSIGAVGCSGLKEEEKEETKLLTKDEYRKILKHLDKTRGSTTPLTLEYNFDVDNGEYSREKVEFDFSSRYVKYYRDIVLDGVNTKSITYYIAKENTYYELEHDLLKNKKSKETCLVFNKYYIKDGHGTDMGHYYADGLVYKKGINFANDLFYGVWNYTSRIVFYDMEFDVAIENGLTVISTHEGDVVDPYTHSFDFKICFDKEYKPVHVEYDAESLNTTATAYIKTHNEINIKYSVDSVDEVNVDEYI